MKVLIRKIQLGLRNRDGEIMIGQDADGQCYLIAEADTFHNPEVFRGLGSTEHIEISKAAFDSLANNRILNQCKAALSTSQTVAPSLPADVGKEGGQ